MSLEHVDILSVKRIEKIGNKIICRERGNQQSCIGQPFNYCFPDQQYQMSAKTVSVDQAEELIKQNKQNPNFKVLDVRTSMQRCMSHIPNSMHLSYFDIENRYQDLDKKFTYLVYCRSGHRSLNSANFLTKQGYDAISMTGGMNAWKSQTQSSCSVM